MRRDRRHPRASPARSRSGRPASRPRPAARAEHARASRCGRSSPVGPAARLGAIRGGDLVGADARAAASPGTKILIAADLVRSVAERSPRRAARQTPSPTIADGAARAQAEAIDGLDGELAIRRRLALETEAPAIRCDAARLAGFGAAELDHWRPARLLAEVVIEGDDAVHLGARQVERLGDEPAPPPARRSRTPPARRAGSAAARPPGRYADE